MVADKCPNGPIGLYRLSPNGLNPLFAPPISPIFTLRLSTKKWLPHWSSHQSTKATD